MTGFLLALAPLALLVATLLAGRYPGERTLAARLRGNRHQPRRRTSGALTATRRRPFATAPRGGRLVGAAIASRPPPLRTT